MLLRMEQEGLKASAGMVRAVILGCVVGSCMHAEGEPAWQQLLDSSCAAVDLGPFRPPLPARAATARGWGRADGEPTQTLNPNPNLNPEP